MKKISSIFLFFFSLVTVAQKVGGVSLSSSGNHLVVNYNITRSPANTVYLVSLNINDDKGNSFTPKSVKGDLKMVYPGFEKKIVWDVLKDTFSLKGKYQAEVEIVKSYNTDFQDGPRCAFASVFLPGLGDYGVYRNAGPLPVLIGGAYLGCLGRATYKYYKHWGYEKKSNKLESASKNQYSWVTQEDAGKMKNLSDLSKKECMQSLLAAASLWAFDILHVAVKGAINKRRELHAEVSGKLIMD